MAHVGSRPRRLAEGADRLVVVERVDEPEPLVEVALRLGHARRDRVMVAAEVVEQGDAVRRGGRVVVLGPRRRRDEEHEEGQGTANRSHARARIMDAPLQGRGASVMPRKRRIAWGRRTV
jgi:hypothetical protein